MADYRDDRGLPTSEDETAAKQADQSTPADVDGSDVKTLPGTGGPDDGGDVEVDPADIHIPHREA
jgi:hypothetical protein